MGGETEVIPNQFLRILILDTSEGVGHLSCARSDRPKAHYSAAPSGRKNFGDAFPGLKPWAIFFSPFGRLERAQDLSLPENREEKLAIWMPELTVNSFCDFAS
jgi:hypothetical protein